MSHGVPDWYRGVNVAYQSLAELINRPKYGAADLLNGEIITQPSATNQQVAALTGKGISYGIHLWVGASASCGQNVWRVAIDGTNIILESIYNIHVHGPLSFCGGLIYEDFYDNTNFSYALVGMVGVTFETSITIRHQNLSGVNANPKARLLYALI